MRCRGVKRPRRSEDCQHHLESEEREERSGNGKEKKNGKCKFDCRYIKVRPNDEIAQMAMCATEGEGVGRGEGGKCPCAYRRHSGEGLFFWR